jgi:DNA-binding response OmpR family regulator
MKEVAVPRDATDICVLLVEDEFLLAAALQGDLEAAGWRICGPHYTLNAAAQAAAEGHYDLAIMDLNLRGQLAYPVAEVLQARGIPVMLLTGYELIDMPERFRRLPQLTKPYDIHAVLREAHGLLQRSGAHSVHDAQQPVGEAFPGEVVVVEATR